MNRRDKARKAERVACHMRGDDTPNGRSAPQTVAHVISGPLHSKPSARKVRRLISRASRKANR